MVRVVSNVTIKLTIKYVAISLSKTKNYANAQKTAQNFVQVPYK